MKRKDAIQHTAETDGPLADSELVRQRRLQRFFSEPLTLDSVREEGQASEASVDDGGPRNVSSEQSLGHRVHRGADDREETNDSGRSEEPQH